MPNLNQIAAPDVEHTFGVATESGRFTSLCNALLSSKAQSAAIGYPILSEKPGPDGSLDGEWTISTDFALAGGLAIAGWNVFQFKARSLAGSTRSQVISKLKSSLRGAAVEVTARLATGNKPVSHYVLFTNLQLGLLTPTENAAGAIYSDVRQELEEAIREGARSDLIVTIVDAGNLAGELNANPALKLTYFGTGVAKTWEEKWEEEWKSSGLKEPAPLVGRETALTDLAAWLADDAVRVITIDGPNGMGKTRVALEATRAHRTRTTVVEVAGEFERVPMTSLVAAPIPRIFILEDPDTEQAERIAKQVLAQSRLKLIITLPTRDKAPWFSSDESAIKLLTLDRLQREPAEKLLKVVNPKIDGDVVDWILQSAGGIPFVILNGAQYGNELRARAGTLKQRLAQKFSARIEKEVGADGVEALRLISPLQWATVTGEKTDLSLLCTLSPPAFGTIRAAELLKKLARMGFARHRGHFCTVTPPIFASSLAEDMFAALPSVFQMLFDQCNDDARRRLLERVVTLELSDAEGFWSYVFERCGSNAERILANAGMFHSLARANPIATARYLEQSSTELARLQVSGGHALKVGELTSATRELVYHDHTCAAGMRIMQTFAIAFPESSADKRFRDAFVHWNPVPLSYADRLDWLKRLLTSANPAERILSAHSLEHATSIPHVLSGYEVTARRMGSSKTKRLWLEEQDYLEQAFALRFKHLADADSAIANLMATGLTNALTRLSEFLHPDRFLQTLDRFMELYRENAVAATEVNVRWLIEVVTTSYIEYRERSDPTSHRKWDANLAQLHVWRKEFDEGPFLRRFKLAVARAQEWDDVEFEGRKINSYEKQCRLLAREVIANPALMTEEAWQLSESAEAWTFHPFVAALCEYDPDHMFLPLLEARGQQSAGARNLAIYLAELNCRDGALASARFNALVAKLPKPTLLVIMDHFRHPPEHRLLLKQWLVERSIDPRSLGASLSRRSLDDVPPAEVAAILEYVATSPDTDHQVIPLLSSYVYREKPLPRELFPLALRLLKTTKRSDAIHYDCSLVAIAIARTDKDAAFALFREQMERVHNEEHLPADDLWDPLGRLKAHNFWGFLVRAWPDEAYRELLQLKGVAFNGVYAPLVDPEKHLSVLLTLSAEVVIARFFAARMGGGQPGFYEFAFAVLSLHPADSTLRTILVRAAMSGEFDHSFDGKHHRQLQVRLEERLQDSTLAAHHRSWLEAARDRAQEGGKQEERIWGDPDQRPGWE